MSMYAKHQVSPAKAAVVEEMKENCRQLRVLYSLDLRV